MPVCPGVVSNTVPVLSAGDTSLTNFCDFKVLLLNLNGANLLSVTIPVLEPSLSILTNFSL